MEGFIIAFEEVETGLKPGAVAYDTRRAMFREQIQNHPDLKYDMAAHVRAEPQDPEWTLEWLKSVCKKLIERNRKRL